MDKPKLLIVDDDESIRTSMKWALTGDYQVFLAQDRPSSLNALRTERPAVVTLDLGLPPNPREPVEGFRALADMLQMDPLVKIVVITGQDDKANAVKAVADGAYDFFCKPIQVEELKVVLKRAFNLYQLESENRDLQARVNREAFEEMLGVSPQIREVFSTIHKVATTDVPVLILGENGTGKELVARAIHRRSERKDGPFVAINCAAIPETLLESELFGHEKGSFTGAHSQRKGRIESAQRGTLFLDEIGDLPQTLQVKLLRFLQEHCIERIGGRKEIPVDIRVIAATNKDIKKAIADGQFREDLYYRLGVVVLTVPPLREREDDVVLIATAFLQRYAAENGKKIKGFSSKAVQALKAHEWPGNVRELENRVKRAVIMAQGATLRPEDLELNSVQSAYQGMQLREAREELEREMVTAALKSTNDNLSRAAAMLGISRPTLYELLEKLGISRK